MECKVDEDNGRNQSFSVVVVERNAIRDAIATTI